MVKKRKSIRNYLADISQTLSGVEPDIQVRDTIETYLAKNTEIAGQTG